MTREKSVLCFGDSITWGYVPLTAGRLLRAERWPGILQKSLGESYYVIKEGLNGRASVFDEPFRDGRNARTTLLAVLESHAPLDLLIIMLGTNDLRGPRKIKNFTPTAAYKKNALRRQRI
jgi:lysophospholipase L1-like esterase